MELVDDEDVKTIITLYCGNRSDQNALIQLFADQSTIREINIDLNVAPDIDLVGDDGYDSSDPCDHEVDSDSDSDMDNIFDDINDEEVNDDRNINAFSVGNQIQRIVIHNNPRAYMLFIHPDATHVAEFSEYLEMLPAHQLAIDSDLEELFVSQRFESNKECIFAIKRYSMNISVDYKFAV
ncbi:hypothetical protein GOBAR_AA00226 [Gossypium barbadense]|uniref:Uncharacterized protein n=1 Tax=Gossypium barbadense TaxID=3634 RepID=A0A2P5YXM1_GOSBA|nr:hypothetical protein GOBAR_AA00226 [Gossypium barbadense]